MLHIITSALHFVTSQGTIAMALSVLDCTCRTGFPVIAPILKISELAEGSIDTIAATFTPDGGYNMGTLHSQYSEKGVREDNGCGLGGHQ
eukprot:1158920-Pelagomonas_calceolata.AAC.7